MKYSDFFDVPDTEEVTGPKIKKVRFDRKTQQKPDDSEDE